MKASTPRAAGHGLLERLLRQVAGEEIAEAARGDLEEESAAFRRRYGSLAARFWIALQVVRLILRLIPRSIPASGRWFTEVTMDGWTSRRRRMVAILGAVAALPAAVIVVSGLVYIFGGNPAAEQALDSTLFDPQGFVYRVLLHPVTVLGGLAVALALNLIPLLRIRLDRQPGNLTGTLAVRLRSAHLAVAALALGLFAVILAYAFTENFSVVPRPPAASKVSTAVAVGAGWTAIRPAGQEWLVHRIPAAEMFSIPALCRGVVGPLSLEAQSDLGRLSSLVLDCPLQSSSS